MCLENLFSCFTELKINKSWSLYYELKPALWLRYGLVNNTLNISWLVLISANLYRYSEAIFKKYFDLEK